MHSRKKFQELTIRDNFMFAAVMMQEDNCKHFLEMLLEIKIREVKLSYEKCLIYNPEYKGVRLDVYGADENNTRYDVELQIAPQHLGKRARYYHSQMDMDILESGHEYSELPATYVIFVCDFDPFGLGKYCYTFENRCLQEFSLPMGDAGKSIFLSTKGQNEDFIPKELKAFLDFVRQDTPGNNTETDDTYVRTLQKTIRRVKENRELERSFMTLDEYRHWGREEGRREGLEEGRAEGLEVGRVEGRAEGLEVGRAEGRAEGIAEGRTEGKNDGMLNARREDILRFLQKQGVVSESLKVRIMSETDHSRLIMMLDFAVSSASIEAFEEKISNL